MPSPDLTEFIELTEAEELRKVVTDLQVKLRRAKAKTEDLVEATLQGAKGAMLALGPVPKVAAPQLDKRRKKAEVALWHLTDWQGAKLTTSYNSKIMRDRVMHFCDIAERFTEIHRAHHPVRDCTIMLGGDLIEGLFNFPQQPFQIDATIFEQYVIVARLVGDVVRKALSIYEHVTVVAEWGNHGRIGAKRASVPSADNFDRMVQELARQLLETEKRLTWYGTAEDIQHVKIGNYRALLIHGDEIGRNGYASPMTIVNHVAKWQSGAHPWEFRDCYLGHYHNHNEWSLPNGRGSVFQTGSPESDNRYAGVNMAASALPSQRLHFIDPDRGRVTANHKIWLDG